MDTIPAILVHDRDGLFLEALQNFLFTAGFPSVDIMATVRKTLARMRLTRYGYVLIELMRQEPCERRWAAIIKRHQPSAKIVFLIRAADQPFVKTSTFDHVIKEEVFSSLLDLMSQHRLSYLREKADGGGHDKGLDQGGTPS